MAPTRAPTSRPPAPVSRGAAAPRLRLALLLAGAAAPAGAIAQRSDSHRFEPGTRWAYSNTGMLVLGKVIEVASGQDYFGYIREHVYRPAGMTSSDSYDLDRVNRNLAVGNREPHTANCELPTDDCQLTTANCSSQSSVRSRQFAVGGSRPTVIRISAPGSDPASPPVAPARRRR